MPLRTVFDIARFEFDIAWAAGEWLSKIVTEPLLKSLCPKGDGNQPVLTLPGFAGPELSLAPLNRFLTQQGFPTQSWGMGTNRGPRGTAYMEEMKRTLGRKIAGLAHKHGRKVSLIGQSLGGIYAREIAREHPDVVERVITLGSPAYMDPDRPHDVNRTVGMAVRLYTGKEHRDHLVDAHAAKVREAPPGVPLIAIYSPLDGVVSEDSTVIPEHDLTMIGNAPRENIEIMGSHCGMGVNPVVLLAICDRLLADPVRWTPFNPMQYLKGPLTPLGRIFYPEHETVMPARRKKYV